MTASRSPRLLGLGLLLAIGALMAVGVAPAFAQAPSTPTTINMTGGAAGGNQRLPAGQAQFGIRVPLRPNAENIVTVTASNDAGQRVSQDVSITQLSLNEIVRAQVTAQRLTTPEVRALVADGTINIQDPANFNVSVFVVVLTIGPRPVQVQVPVVTPKEEPLGFGPPISIGCSSGGGGIQTTERSISIPCGDGGGGNGTPTIQIVPFEIAIPDAQIEARVPGVIIIEGRIKTLKEFFRVNLLLMNVSGLFNLTDIMARLEVPEGALSHVTPKSGTVDIADIAPGGEGNGTFIVRGDRIGTHTVTAHFGAMLNAPFLPEPVPISGSASTDLDVKGPPDLDVTVTHPSYVQAGVPYDLQVTIRNTDEELDALYASFEIDVGIDAELLDDVTGLPLEGPAIRDLGDILRGQSVTQTFKVRPKKTGPIASCTAAANQNIQLSVVFTDGGPNCAIGTLPARMASPDGRPTVSVVPSHNTSGVTTEPAIAALFSAPMITQTITTGFDGATFRLIDPAGNILPSYLQFGDIFGGTAAVLRPNSPLAQETEYTVVIEDGIFDEEGRQLASGLIARFTTEGAPVPPDFEPPQAILLVDPPVNPHAIIQGQLVPVTVESMDNVAVTRVDLRLDGELIDTKRPNSPVHFQVDSASLAPGSDHQLTAIVVDAAGNQSTSSAMLRIAPDATPPSVSIVAAPSLARGRPLSVLVEAADDGRVDKVQLFLDGAAEATAALLVAPFTFTVQTSSLGVGPHVLRALAIDGDGNSGFADHALQIVDDSTPPTVVISSPTDGLSVRAGTSLAVIVTAVDNIGVSVVETYLDNEPAPRATGTTGFNLPTADLSVGVHRVRTVARDLAGNITSVEAHFTLFVPAPDTTPPPAPDASKIQVGLPSNGIVAITALAGAVENSAAVEILNTTSQAGAQVPPTANGAFTSQIEGSGAQSISFVAIDAAGNRSAATLMPVPVPASLTSILVTPASLTLDRVTPTRSLAVTGVFSDSTQAPLTSGVVFTSLDRAVADVNVAGLVAAGQNGTTTVRVSADGVPPVDVPVTVAFPTITSVTVSPGTITLREVGRTQRLTVTALYSDNTTQPFTGTVGFATSNPAVGTVDSSGLVTASGPGQTFIGVAPAGFAPISVTLNVEIRTLTSITVSPTSITLTGAGQTQALTVTGHYSDGSSDPITGGISFVSSDPEVAAVANGVVTSGRDGNVTLVVTVAGAPPAIVSVRVKSLVSIALVPDTVTIVGIGQTRQLAVVGTFSDGSTIDNPAGVTFQSSAAGVATVSASGLVTSTGSGSATITAQLGALAPASTAVTVTDAQPIGLIVTPDTHTFTEAGATTTLQVLVRFDNQTTQPPSGAPAFTSRNALVALAGANGVITAVANGSTIVDVAADGFAATVSITVDIPPLVAPPVIDSLDRPRAAEGDRFAIRGTHFGDLPAENLVFINGAPAEVLGARHDEIVARVPRNAGPGPVHVVVGGQASNPVTLGIYTRRATSTQVTSAIPSGPGPIVVSLPSIEARQGDRVFLSSAPDVLAPLAFTGTASVSVDGGTAIPVPPSAAAFDLTSQIDTGLHALEIRIVGATVATGPIYAIVGPDATGAIAGEHSVLSVNHSLPAPVTFTGLLDLANNPVPDGTVVAVSVLGSCNHRDRLSNCLESAGGQIVGGSVSPSFGDPRVRNFVVTGGRVDVLYDPLGTELGVSSSATARVMVLPTNANGTISGNRALAHTPVTLTALDTVHAPRSQSAVIADGLQKTVTIDLQDFRDSLGDAVPDVAFVASTLGSCYHRDRNFNCLSSAGGDIVGGSLSPEFGNVAHTRVFTIANDRAEVQYQPGSVVTPVGTVTTALVQILPARPGGVRISNRTFSDTPITLSSAFADQAQLTVTPGTVLADNGDNRVVIVAVGLVGADGNPVPDGTKVVASTLGSCHHRDRNSDCISSAGGVIKNGAASPDFGNVGHTRVLDVSNGQVQVIYSAEGVALETPTTATSRVALIPAQSPAGQRIGNHAFAVADITLASFGSAVGAASPASVVADGTPKTVLIAVSNIRDEAGNPVPDGAVVVVSTLGSCNHRDRNGACVDSAGGTILNGDLTPEFGDVGHTRYFVVAGGQITVHYDPQGVLVSVPNTATARVQMLPGRPNGSRGSRIGNRAFHIVPITLTAPTVDPADVTAVPASIVANGGDNRVTVTVTNIRDAQGLPVIDGTKVVVSTLGSCNHRDAGGSCIGGTGGTLETGAVGPEFGNVGHTRVHTVTNGAVQVVYNSTPNAFGTAQSDTAFVQFLPSTPAGARIGNRAFAVAPIVVAGMGSADIAGPGSVAATAQAVYTVTNVRDLNGTLLPDGTRVVVSTLGACNHRDPDNNCISSAGGSIVDGDVSPEFGNVGHTRVFTVVGGGFSFTYQAPAAGTSVLQLLPSRPTGARIGNRAFSIKSVSTP
jgi:hypothetical protein